TEANKRLMDQHLSDEKRSTLQPNLPSHKACQFEPKQSAPAPGRIFAKTAIIDTKRAVAKNAPHRPARPRLFYWSRKRWASRAAMQPVPALVIAWRYTWSCTSPAANTPGTLVCVAKPLLPPLVRM